MLNGLSYDPNIFRLESTHSWFQLKRAQKGLSNLTPLFFTSPPWGCAIIENTHSWANFLLFFMIIGMTVANTLRIWPQTQIWSLSAETPEFAQEWSHRVTSLPNQDRTSYSLATQIPNVSTGTGCFISIGLAHLWRQCLALIIQFWFEHNTNWYWPMWHTMTLIPSMAFVRYSRVIKISHKSLTRCNKK